MRFVLSFLSVVDRCESLDYLEGKPLTRRKLSSERNSPGKFVHVGLLRHFDPPNFSRAMRRVGESQVSKRRRRPDRPPRPIKTKHIIRVLVTRRVIERWELRTWGRVAVHQSARFDFKLHVRWFSSAGSRVLYLHRASNFNPANFRISSRDWCGSEKPPVNRKERGRNDGRSLAPINYPRTLSTDRPITSISIFPCRRIPDHHHPLLSPFL